MTDGTDCCPSQAMKVRTASVAMPCPPWPGSPDRPGDLGGRLFARASATVQSNSRPMGRSRVFRSCASSPASRWGAVAVLERAAECRLRRVADVLRDERDRKGGVAEQVGGGVEAYVREIGGRRLPDASDEPRSERRPGKAARSGQLLDRPIVAGVSMDSA